MNLFKKKHEVSIEEVKKIYKEKMRKQAMNRDKTVKSFIFRNNPFKKSKGYITLGKETIKKKPKDEKSLFDMFG